MKKFSKYYEYYYDRASTIPQQLDLKEIKKFASIINHNKCYSILDLGCAEGELSVFLAKKGHDVTAVDISETQLNKVNTKSRNLKNNPLTSEELNKFNAIIIDPPRSGAKSQFLNIAHSNVPIIISISCNINTFVRDAKILIQNNYELKWVQPIDQFLYTSHVEVVGLFELNLVN